MPDDIPFNGTHFSPKQRELLHHVTHAGPYGIDTHRLFDKLYADDPDGGPLTRYKVIHIMVCQTNIKLKPHGKKIVGTRTGHGAPGIYRLVDIP